MTPKSSIDFLGLICYTFFSQLCLLPPDKPYEIQLDDGSQAKLLNIE